MIKFLLLLIFSWNGFCGVSISFTHTLSSMQSEEKKQKFTKRFFKECPVQNKLKRLAPLEEPLAVAAGQMLFTEKFYPKKFVPTEKWYSVPWFNLMGRLIYPLVRSYYDHNRAVDMEFIDKAANLCREALDASKQLKKKLKK